MAIHLNGLGMVGGDMMDGGMVDGSVMHRGMIGRLVMRLARVLDVGNVARVGVIDMVGHGLEAAVRKLDVVLALGGVAVAALAGTEVEAVLVGDAVLIRVVGGSGLVVGLVVAASVVRGGGVVDWGMVDGSMVHWGMMDRGMVHRGMVHWSMVHGGMVHGSMVRWAVVSDSRGGKGSNEDEVLK